MKCKTMTLYRNDECQNARVPRFPLVEVVQNADDLQRVVAYDHVCPMFKQNYRKDDNFIKANCSIFDVDNMESDDPNEWTNPDDIRSRFPEVQFYVSYSRNHMKPKGEKTARPKFHVYFPHKEFTDIQEYRKFKINVCTYFPQFDQNAKDVSHFFFGVLTPQVEYHDGTVLLSDFMQTISVSTSKKDVKTRKKSATTVQAVTTNIIPEGERNSTMYRYALSVLTRWGDVSDEAFRSFNEESCKCVPLLDEKELNSIWKNALTYYRESIKSSRDYVSPEQFNKAHNTFPLALPVVDQETMNSIQKIDKKYRKFTLDIARRLLKAFGITIKFNEMNRQIEIEGLPQQYRGEDSCNILETLMADIANTLRFKRSATPTIHDVFTVIAKENSYHPVIKLLDAEPWDNLDRLTDIFSIMGVNEEFHKTLIKKWALQTIAILYNSEDNPVTAQGVLVLQGEQGIGKTMFFRHLAIHERFFKGGATLDMNNKDSLMSSTKVWICELGEIDSTTKKEQSALKAFLTEQTDRFREPYARNEIVRSRRTSFCGTVNPKWYLRDETGNRRYWTIPVAHIDIAKLTSYSSDWYVQFWRQIKNELQKNPKGYLLTHDEQDKVNNSNADYETEIPSESEFFDTFNVDAPKSAWVWITAAEIALRLNDKYKHLNIRSENIGRQLIPRIQKRIGQEFERKTVNGKRLIHCPPSKTEEAPFDDYGIQAPPIHTEIVSDDTDEEIVF